MTTDDTSTAHSPEIELSDEDILDAMQHVAGYVDISTEDFRTVYHLALRHAVARLCGNLGAREPALTTAISLAKASDALQASGHAALPVVDEHGKLRAVLLRADFYAAFGWDSPP